MKKRQAYKFPRFIKHRLVKSKAEDYNKELKSGEIEFAQHNLEFQRFYEKHKRLCDEMSGLKIRTVGEVAGPDRMIITRVNFSYAIKRLNVFIIDNLHYIGNHITRKNMEDNIQEIETDFLNNEEYQNYIRKADNLTNTAEMQFNIMYLDYLKKCFELAYEIGFALQSSVSISSREVVKTIAYVDYKGFFYNLSAYRDEMADNISNITYSELQDHYKKIMGYFYTYRYLITQREQRHIMDLLDLIYAYITNPEVTKIIMKLKSDGEKTKTFTEETKRKLQRIKLAFNKIYFLCNWSLSMKNILPKSSTRTLIDKTLI